MQQQPLWYSLQVWGNVAAAIVATSNLGQVAVSAIATMMASDSAKLHDEDIGQSDPLAWDKADRK